MPTLAVRILIALSIAALLLFAWLVLRAVGPTYGSNEDGIMWSIQVSPETPIAGETISVTISVGGAQSPFMSPNIQIDQDENDPAVAIATVQGGSGVKVTLDALAPGTATLRATGFLEKYVCTEEPPPNMPPCFPHGFYATSPDIVIEVLSSDCGDANGDGAINSLDATWTLQYAAGLILTLVAPMNLDVNGDGNIDALDATIMLQHAAGLIPAPTCT